MKIGNTVVDVVEGRVSWTSGLSVDADGCPSAYAPLPLHGLDFLDNAKSNGKWVGLVCNSSGQPYVQGTSDPCPGMYVSATALQNSMQPIKSPLRYVDSSKVPYISMPPELRKVGLRLGDVAWVSYRGRGSAAVIADIGPSGRVGEGSIALALALAIPSSPRNGGTDSGVTFVVWIGSHKGWPRPLDDIIQQVNDLRKTSC